MAFLETRRPCIHCDAVRTSGVICMRGGMSGRLPFSSPSSQAVRLASSHSLYEPSPRLLRQRNQHLYKKMLFDLNTL